MASLKLVLVGNEKSGKTCLITRLARDTFDPAVAPSVGATFVKTNIATDVAADCWDTSGNARYRSLCPMYVRGAAAVLLCAAADDAQSLTDLFDIHRETIEKSAPEAHVLVVITKTDLAAESGATVIADSDIAAVVKRLRKHHINLVVGGDGDDDNDNGVVRVSAKTDSAETIRSKLAPLVASIQAGRNNNTERNDADDDDDVAPKKKKKNIWGFSKK